MIGLYIFFLGCLMVTFGKLITMNATIRKLTTSKFLRPAITSESNEKVKFIRSLTQKKKRDSSGTVLLEGFRQIEDAFKYGIAAKYVMISERVVESPMAKSLIDTYLTSSTDLLDVVSDPVMASLSETVNSQGIVAAFFKPLPQKNICLPKDQDFGPGPVVVLDRLADPGNVGTIVRSCFGFGVNTIVTVSGGCDIWSPKVLRSAMGLCVNPTMPILELASWTDIEDQLQNYEDELRRDGKGKPLQVLVADGAQENLSYDEVDFLHPTVLIVGSEAHGPSPEALNMSFKVIKIRIPMTRKLESFNAAVAVSVILGESARQRNAASRTQRSMKN